MLKFRSSLEEQTSELSNIGAGDASKILEFRSFQEEQTSELSKIGPGDVLDALGTLLGHSWALLGHSWALLGHSWALLGRSWGSLGALLGASWAPLGRNLEISLGTPTFWAPTWRPKSNQVGSKIYQKSITKNDLISQTIFNIFSTILHEFWTPKIDVFLIDFLLQIENVNLWKLAFRLDGSTIFKVSRGWGLTKKRQKIDPN